MGTSCARGSLEPSHCQHWACIFYLDSETAWLIASLSHKRTYPHITRSGRSMQKEEEEEEEEDQEVLKL
ncbi:Hypothetical predicted protein [Podarcis lilfordi]|uniref:Uncharacterized protein n=1 Tax=Podarcis lilfordi TaxID=74358 RepID=A0AA35KG05_9SAUR|nr:Hypothetical predicted protein [Podarcis lilfordi]